MKKDWSVWLPVVLLAVVALSACGGGGDSPEDRARAAGKEFGTAISFLGQAADAEDIEELACGRRHGSEPA